MTQAFSILLISSFTYIWVTKRPFPRRAHRQFCLPSTPLDGTGWTLWNRARSMAGTVATLTGCVCGQLPRLLNAITTVRPSGTRSLLCCLPKNVPQPASSKPRKGAFFSSSLSFPNFDSWVHGSILFAPLLKMLFSTADFCLLCARKGNFPHSLVLSSPPFLYHTFTNLFMGPGYPHTSPQSPASLTPLTCD